MGLILGPKPGQSTPSQLTESDMTEHNLIHRGKVRDIYDLGEHLRLVATNRLSAFDRAIASIPQKARVLNELSAWWFGKTQHIIPNHLIEMDSPESMIVKKCTVFPVEVVVRGYITGSTNTSMWTLYKQGQRDFFETTLPDGLSKNQALPKPVLTPTTKDADHDRPMSVADIQSGERISPDDWAFVAQKAIELFQFGQSVAQHAGLILVDTKFEFGRDEQGNILLIDECLTPDSSRYWRLETFEERTNQGLEPENFDKEFIRLWFRENCNPYEDKPLPQAPQDLIEQASKRYLDIYQRLTSLKD